MYFPLNSSNMNRTHKKMPFPYCKKFQSMNPSCEMKLSAKKKLWSFVCVIECIHFRVSFDDSHVLSGIEKLTSHHISYLSVIFFWFVIKSRLLRWHFHKRKTENQKKSICLYCLLPNNFVLYCWHKLAYFFCERILLYTSKFYLKHAQTHWTKMTTYAQDRDGNSINFQVISMAYCCISSWTWIVRIEIFSFLMFIILICREVYSSLAAARWYMEEGASCQRWLRAARGGPTVWE